MQKDPQILRFELEMAMMSGRVYTLKDEKTDTFYCELTPEQEPRQRQMAQQDIARKRELKREEESLKLRLKAIKTETDAIDDRILSSGEALNFTPPKGRFSFTGKHVASIEPRKEWLVDLESGAPIIETVQELSKASVVAIDEIRQGIQTDLPFPDGEHEQDSEPESDDSGDSDEAPEAIETAKPEESPDDPFGTTEEPAKPKRSKKSTGNPDMN